MGAEMTQRKKISQREAMRNRRELRRLREFVGRISGYAAMDYVVSGQVPVGQWVCGQMAGAQKAAGGRVVFLARRLDADRIEVGFTSVPQEG